MRNGEEARYASNVCPAYVVANYWSDGPRSATGELTVEDEEMCGDEH